MYFALLGPIGYGIANSLSKITGNAVGFIRGAILLSFSSSICLFLLNLFFGTTAFELKWALITFLFGIYGYIPVLFFIKAVTTGKVGVIIPVVDMNVIFPVILSYLFLNQYLPTLGVLFILVIFLGVVVMSVDFRDFRNSSILDLESGIFYALLASVFWGTGYFIWNYSVIHIGPYYTSMFIELGVLFAALIHLLLINKEKLFGTIPKNIFWVGILIGFFVSLGDLGTNLGIATVGVPLTMAIMGGRPAVGAIAGYFIFKEKLNIRQILALFTIMIGVIGVSLYK